jgi:hypothetical protein
MSRGWPFLVARGRRTDYRTVLVPDFLAGQRLQSLLADALHAPDDGALRHVVLRNASTGPLTASYRAEVLRPADMQAAREDHDAPTGAAYLSDEHGRPLEFLYGLLQPGAGGPAPADVDMSRARAAALDSYRTFLLDEDGFTFQRSEALPLTDSPRPDRVAADEHPLPVAPPRGPQHPQPPTPLTRGPAFTPRPPAGPQPAERRRGPRGGAFRSAVLAAALALIVLTVVVVALTKQPAKQPAAAGQVVKAELLGIVKSADTSSCTAPFRREVTARVTVKDAPANLVFHLRENDRNGEEWTLPIRKSSPTNILVPVDLDNGTGQLSLIVTAPNEMTSKPLRFDLKCGGSSPAGASAPPTATASSSHG